MTHIVFFKTDGVYYGFEELGHAGFDETGNDVLCAALSAMTMLIVNTIEVAFASGVEYTIDEKTTDIRVIARGALEQFESDEKKRFAVSRLIESYFLQLTDMVEDYYDFLAVDEKETDEYIKREADQ
jgi:uncharacterized protein YsxB (DUF464 family)